MYKVSYIIKNSTHFMEKINSPAINSKDTMISFDVVSLFTKVPMKEVIPILKMILEQDDSLEDRTAITPGELCNLVELCVKSTYFCFEETFYEQKEGASMGSPLSPILANIYMERLEEEAIKNFPLKPSLWCRYVDDVFALWPHDNESIQDFKLHLNKQNKHIQFTTEEENENKIAFLDVQIERKNNKFITSIFRKKTHTDKYLNYKSNHHPRILSGVVKCLTDRAKKLCHPSEIEQELKHLKEVFLANGYPEQTINSNIKSKRNSTTNNSTKAQDETIKYLVIPYVKGISEKIEHVCRSLNIKTVFTSTPTLKKHLMKVKTPREKSKMKGVVYEIPCMDCSKVYIGETRRTLDKRLKEHQYAVKRHDEKNGIAVHAWNSNHKVNWLEAKVKERVENYTRRRITEAVVIQSLPSTSNLDNGLELNPTWQPIIASL